MRNASPTFSIDTVGDRFVARATFAPGIATARRPIVGDPQASPGAAMINLLGLPALAYTLTSMINPPVAPDAD